MGSRKQLAKELNIPEHQIDQVVQAIHKDLKKTVPDKALLTAIRQDQQLREKYKTLHLRLFQPAQLPQQNQSDLNLQTLTNGVSIPLPTADKLLDTIQKQIPFVVTKEDIAAAVRTMPSPTDSPEDIIHWLEIFLLTTKLNTTVAEVQQLLETINDRYKLSITYHNILEFIENTPSSISVQDIRDHYYQEWKLAFEVARILHTSDNEAWLFMLQIRKRVSWPFPHQQLITTLKSLPYHKKSLADVALALDIQYVSQQLQLTIPDAHELINHIQQNISETISNSQIINALPFIEVGIIETYSQQFQVLWEISTTLQCSIGQANQFLQEIKAHTASDTTYKDILEAFYATSIHEISVASVLKKLTEQQIAYQLGLSMVHFVQLPEKISLEVNAHVSQQHIIQVAQKLGTVASLETVREYFWKKHYPIPQIAKALGIESADARLRLKQIKQGVHFEIDDNEILAAVEMGGGGQTAANIINLIYARKVATQLHNEPRQAPTLLAVLANKVGRGISGQEMVMAWESLPAENKTLDNLIGLFQVKTTWSKGFLETVRFVQAIHSRMAKPEPLVILWSLVQEISSPLRNEKGAITYLDLRYFLKNDTSNSLTLNRLATKIFQHPDKDKFWDLVHQCYSPEGLTAQDVNYLLQLINWTILPVLLPDKVVGELGITHLYLNRILEGRIGAKPLPSGQEQNQQSLELQTYATRCWEAICSKERQYQVPSNGRAEVIVPPSLTSLLNLYSVRFVQEHINPPGLFIQFKFGTPSLVGVVHIDPSGYITGFHRIINNIWFQALIEAIALSHYHALVIPYQVYPEPRLPSSHQITNKQAPNHSIAKPFPVQRPQQKRYSLSDWYESQEIARHSVRGHTRWIGRNFVASVAKRNEAKKAGVQLQLGYTWIPEHERGNPQKTKVPLDGEDLTKHTIFTHSPRAESELGKIVSWQ